MLEEANVTGYKDFSIYYKSYNRHGIFFRSPIQLAHFSIGYPYLSKRKEFSVWDYAEKIKNPFRRFFEILIGNKNIVDNLPTWIEEYDSGKNDENGEWVGFSANILCSPIYFYRQERMLEAVNVNPESTNRIISIKSHGYESEFNQVTGNCVVEVTKIEWRSGKKDKTKKWNSYKYTYPHIIEDLIDLFASEEKIKEEDQE